MGYAEVQAHSVFPVGGGFRNLWSDDRDEPPSGLFGHRHLGVSAPRQVASLAGLEPDPTDHRKLDAPVVHLDDPCQAEPADASVPGLEPRIASPACQEVLERPVEVTKGLLRGSLAGLVHPGDAPIFNLDLLQGVEIPVKADGVGPALPFLGLPFLDPPFVGFAVPAKTPVVGPPGVSRVLEESLTLTRCWPDLCLVGQPHWSDAFCERAIISTMAVRMT